MDLLQIYNIFLKEYGQQNWWPVTEEGKLNPEYSGGPKTDKQRLEVSIGAILTQNTSWKNVEKAIVNLNLENLINIKKITKTKNEDLEKIIRPSGFFRQKAERLKIFCNFISDKKFEDLTRSDLLQLKGIGQETADSILLYSCGKPEFVIDAYTKRIFSRIGIIQTENLAFLFQNKGYSTQRKGFAQIDWDSYDDVKEFFQNNLPKDVNIYQEFHALIVEHAKMFCKRVPECQSCTIKKSCDYYKSEDK